MYNLAGYDGLGEDPGQDPTDYLQMVWGSFVDLSPRIIDLQHRAALAAQAAASVHDQESEALAKLVIHELAKLQKVHHKILSWSERAGAMVGLGVIQIPIGVAGVTVVALLVAWSFRKFAAQSEALGLLERGILTAEEFQALDIMDPPGIGGEIAGLAGGIGKWVVLALLAFTLLEATRAGLFRRNPPLVMFGNPPDDGLMSEGVKLIAYEHAEDGELYLHEFADGVEMEALEDGSVSIGHPEHGVWSDY